jgi:hypothetical protein
MLVRLIFVALGLRGICHCKLSKQKFGLTAGRRHHTITSGNGDSDHIRAA